jgi:hypothetical protein
VNNGKIGRAVRTVIDEQLDEVDADPEDVGLPESLSGLLRAWAVDHPHDARKLIELESPDPKTPAQLDQMVTHIRYEVMKLTWFLRIGNGWVPPIKGLPGADVFADESLLEAALMHIRCIAEFLRPPGRADNIAAADYLPDWEWAERRRLTKDLKQIHGRVAHLGLVRCSVQIDAADFDWREFLTRDGVRILLGGFREFLAKLPAERFELFNQVTADDGTVVIMDLDALIAQVLGSRA